MLATQHPETVMILRLPEGLSTAGKSCRYGIYDSFSFGMSGLTKDFGKLTEIFVPLAFLFEFAM